MIPTEVSFLSPAPWARQSFALHRLGSVNFFLGQMEAENRGLSRHSFPYWEAAPAYLARTDSAGWSNAVQ